MKTLVKMVIAILFLAFAGLDYIENDAEEKVFLPDSYYSIKVEKEPDYRLLYNATVASLDGSKNMCNLDPKDIPEGYLQVKTGDGVECSFPIALKDGEDVNTFLSASKEDGVYKFDVEENRPIIAPKNCTLVNNSVVEDVLYPEDGSFSMGVKLSVITKEETRDGKPVRFKITYGSLGRLWCCMDKTVPESHKNSNEKYPVYKHTVDFTGNIEFQQGNVLGVSGRTSNGNDDKSYIYIKVEKDTGDGFADTTLADLCGTKN